MQDSIIESREIAQAALNDDTLQGLIDTWGLEEVVIGFRALAGDLHGQFSYKGGDREWKKRAGHLFARVNARTAALSAELKRRNREETANVATLEKKWAAFAERVARRAYLIDPAALADIEGPGADITAEEWLYARMQQQASKASKRGDS